MANGIGSRLGVYEIVARLGAGGMGEVYRARDTRLGREVAIKLIRADLTADPRRRERFEQEARAASRLNHPGIVTLHGIDSVQGPDGPVDFLVMELVKLELLLLDRFSFKLDLELLEIAVWKVFILIPVKKPCPEIL